MRKLIAEDTFREIYRAIDECVAAGEISGRQAMAATFKVSAVEGAHGVAKAALELADMAVGVPERHEAVVRRQPVARMSSRQEVVAIMMLRYFDGLDIFTGEEL
jgi:hypothetical protein